jgi:putative molybdopterin biosynthesis protein
MDGIAVKAEVTFGASSSSPKRLSIGKDADFIDTGRPIKEGFDAVVKIEDVIEIDDSTVEVSTPVPPGKDVRFKGEDFKIGDTIIPRNHRIRPIDIGAMLSCGLLEVDVRRKPKVSIIPTGSEIVEPKDELQLGDIVDCNSYIAEGMIGNWGGLVQRQPIVRNDKEKIEQAIRRAVSCSDIVIVIAGSSAGSEDYTVSVIKKMGEVFIHGVDLMPGKPVILAQVEEKPVIGLPGYPLSAFVILDIYVKELIANALGVTPEKREKLKAILKENIPSKLGMHEIVRVKLLEKDGRVFAFPLKRGAGVLSSLVKADGLLHIPKDEEGVNEGAEVEIEILKE